MKNKQASRPNLGDGFQEVILQVAQSDIRPVVRGELNMLERQLKNSLYSSSDTLTRYYLQDVLKRIDLILNPVE